MAPARQLSQHAREQARAQRDSSYAEQRKQQVAALTQLDAFRQIPATELQELVQLCTLRVFPAGWKITREHTANDYLYVILHGTMRLTLHDRDANEVLIGVLDRGDCFGEGPLFGDLFRGATAHTETVCYLLQIPLVDLRGLLPKTPELERLLRAIYRHRLIQRTLGRVPLFGQLSTVERARLAMLVEARSFQRGDLVIRQGMPGSALYLLEFGQATVERAGRVIAYLDEGDFFGEMSLLSQEPHNADIRAHTPLNVLVLPSKAFHDLIERLPEIAARVQQVIIQRRSNTPAKQDNERVQQLTIAIDHGMLRGSRLLVRDSTRCAPDCTRCEDACRTRHGRARLNTTGVSLGDLAVVDTCRQCRVGAECVEACPEDAIQWNRHGALTVSNRCTGCGECVLACPYHAIQTISLDDNPSQTPFMHFWQQLRFRKTSIPLEALHREQRADKCDLCHGYDDLACVSACPTGALRIVPVEEIFPL